MSPSVGGRDQATKGGAAHAGPAPVPPGARAARTAVPPTADTGPTGGAQSRVGRPYGGEAAGPRDRLGAGAVGGAAGTVPADGGRGDRSWAERGRVSRNP
ncbi:hypothetical protein GCM10009551_056060 [Nocardiopsis tropica]